MKKKAEATSGSIGVQNLDMKRDFIDEFLDERPHIMNFVGSIMRNGLMEKQYHDSLVTGRDLLNIGRYGLSCFTEGAGRWRGLKPSMAVKLLAHVLGKSEVATWFKGEARLNPSLVVKALCFKLGVSLSTRIPQGHPFALCEVPLSQKVMEVAKQFPVRLQNTTKETLDNDSDYFALDMDGNVVCNVDGCVVEMTAVNLAVADDWVIVDGSDYERATLVSASAGFHSALAPAYEKNHAIPSTCTPFDFVDMDCDVCSVGTGLSGVSSSSAQSLNNEGLLKVVPLPWS